MHSLWHRPEHGWDPVSAEYAPQYSAHADAEFDPSVLDSIEGQIGALRGRRILDLGGGPGQHSVALALRGGQVVWHDVSRSYLEIARSRAAASGARVEFSLGYLEDARRFQSAPFDLVFCRVCWHYCRSDRRFARLLYSLLKPGGAAYIDCNTPAFARSTGLRTLQSYLNSALGFKVGHPYPPRGRIAKLFHAFPAERVSVDYSSEWNDRVLFVKSLRQPAACPSPAEATQAAPNVTSRCQNT
ncbi:MAG: class I SAM-dependent methyltransferase [Bryobacteraceae bacterium]